MTLRSLAYGGMQLLGGHRCLASADTERWQRFELSTSAACCRPRAAEGCDVLPLHQQRASWKVSACRGCIKLCDTAESVVNTLLVCFLTLHGHTWIPRT